MVPNNAGNMATSAEYQGFELNGDTIQFRSLYKVGLNSLGT